MTPITYEFKPGERYPVIMVCADAVVFSKNSENALFVALIERGDNGKLALPGGFVEYKETSLETAVRELWEETSFEIYFPLENSPSSEHVKYLGYLHFDDPNRTKVGNRKITTAHVFQADESLKLEGGDDAKDAFWMPVEFFLDLKDDEVHDDHKLIVSKCLELYKNQKEK